MDNDEIQNCLQFFSNGTHLTKKKEEDKKDKEEYRFYKKRIFYLFKDIMMKKEKEPDVVEAFNDFCNVAVKYLKFKDKSSVLQEEYKDLSGNRRGKHCYNTFKNEPLDQVQYSNHLLMKEHVVKTKSITDCLPIVKKTLKDETPIVIPQKKEINMRDPRFKNVGINAKQNKRKIKNVNNTYGETKHEKN